MSKIFVKNRVAPVLICRRLGFAICCFAEVTSSNRAAVITPPLIPPRGGNVETRSHENSPLEGGQRGVAHPFYVSICSIDHNAKTKSLEITFKVFTEDLESAVEAQGAERLRLGSENESPKSDQYIQTYLKKRVTIQVDGDTMAFSYVGKEIETDETWCYAEVASVPSVSKLTIRNSLLMERFEAQQNIVHVKVRGKQKSLVLWKDKREGSVEF